MSDDLGELENVIVKKEATLHRLSHHLFAMARHVHPIAIPHLSKNSFHCSLPVRQADHVDTSCKALDKFDLILRFGNRSCVWSRRLSDSENRKIVSHIRCG